MMLFVNDVNMNVAPKWFGHMKANFDGTTRVTTIGFLIGNKGYIRTGSDSPYVFNSIIDALNFMTKDGWEFVQAYAFSVGQSGNVYH
jgi:hypothetical protein